GLIAQLITDVPGSSDYFVGGAVTYSNAMKTSLLGVAPELLASHGAVSEPVAEAMARGAAAKFDTDYAVAVTGIAGPAGGTPQKPVGLVFLAVADRESATVRRLRLGCDAPRDIIRRRAAMSALNLLRLRISSDSGPPTSG
ncbi:MAG: CinA family protein, partial [Planctomycetes bacterium]|nr:CinA family protein [Planctomycetota bacterium]